MSTPGMPQEAFYTGDSMRGVFVPGDVLSLAETAFEALRAGDVVAIFERTPYYVHRIVEKNADCAVTMGDNNGRPDTGRLTPESRFMLVMRARGPDGVVRSVPGGNAGMKQFRRQQRRRQFRLFAGALVRQFRLFGFLRLPANTETGFRDGTVQWSFGGIPVAARAPSGAIRYLHWSKRLFFRIPVQKRSDVAGRSFESDRKSSPRA